MANPETKTCQTCKQNFVIENDDFAFYEKIQVPPPTWCPSCRFQRRISFRNDHKLFRNTNAITGAPILAIYPPDSQAIVYDDKDYWSDSWDALSTGRDYDFSRPFFKQFFELSQQIPRPSRNFFIDTLVNSEYSANAGHLKNCYLVFNCEYNEDCTYGNAVYNSKGCVDMSHCDKCERCYNSFWVEGCYRTHFSSQCTECRNVWLSKDCKDCSDCVGCVGLRNAKYQILNRQYSKEDYEKMVAEMRLDTWEGLQKAREQARALWQSFPNKCQNGIKNVDSTGAYVNNSKNVKYGYLVRGSEDCKYSQYLQVAPNKDCYDFTIWGENNEVGYECVTSGGHSSNLKFSIESWTHVRDIEYCMFCHDSSKLFGCVGVRKKQYCIFNKQYSKEEYETLVSKIKRHMDEMPYTDKLGRVYKYGEFFPSEFSSFAYNQTLAYDHFPLNKEEALSAGYKWQDPTTQDFQITIKAKDLPNSINEVDETILKEIIGCQTCERAYRIIKPELDALKQEQIPLPRTCIDCRHTARIQQLLPYRFSSRQCDCKGEIGKSLIANRLSEYKNTNNHFHKKDPCPNTFITAYSPDRPDIVYCESCYQAEVA